MESDSSMKEQAKTASSSNKVNKEDNKTLESKESIIKYQNSDEQNKYNQFFNQTKKESLEEIVQILKNHQIFYNQDYSYEKEKDSKISLEIKSENLNFITLRANVTIGPFSTSFLINYDFKDDYIKEKEKDKDIETIVIGKAVGKGSFGDVNMSITRQNSIVKCIKIDLLPYFQNKVVFIKKLCKQMDDYQVFIKGTDQNEEARLRKKKHQQNQAKFKEYQAQILAVLQGKLLLSIKEVFFLKIASALEIAPKIHKICDVFDFLINQQGFLFQMEICHRNINNITKQMEAQLKKKLFRLHFLRIVHRDIKPENILVNKKNKPFFIDFGGCDLLQNQQNTHGKYYMTVYTPEWCHHNLMKVKEQGWGNLYYYDLFSLQKILNKFRKNQISKQKQQTLKDPKQNSSSSSPQKPLSQQQRLKKIQLRKAKKYIYAYILTLNNVYSKLQNKKQKQKQKQKQKEEQKQKNISPIDNSAIKIEEQKKNRQPTNDRVIKMKEYFQIAKQDRVFMENITVIHHCSSYWSKNNFEKQFNLSALCIDNLPYLDSLRQRIENQCIIKIDFFNNKPKPSKSKYLKILTSVKMVDIWSNIQFESLPLMRLYIQDFRKFSVETLITTLKAEYNENNSIIDMISSIIHFINFKTKRYAVSFDQKVQIIRLIARYLGNPFVKETDLPIEVIREGVKFLILYFQQHFKITENYLAAEYLTLLSNCVILQAYKIDDWQRWYNKLIDDSPNCNFRLLNSMKFIWIYYCQYCRPFNQNSLFIAAIQQMILSKLQNQLRKVKQQQAIHGILTQIKKFIVELIGIMYKSDNVAVKYDQLCAKIYQFTFLDKVAVEECIKVVISFKIMVSMKGVTKSQQMIIYCQGNTEMQFSDMIFITLVSELYGNNHKRLRDQLSNIDRIIDCSQISDRLLLIIRLNLSLYENDTKKTSGYLKLVGNQLSNIYNYNNYLPLNYLKYILIDRSRRYQMLNIHFNIMGDHFDHFIALNVQQIKKFFMRANQIQQKKLSIKTIFNNFETVNSIFLQLVEDFVVARTKYNRKMFEYEKLFRGINFFKDFAESQGNEPHGKFSLMFRIGQLSGHILDCFSCILKQYTIQWAVADDKQKDDIYRVKSERIKKTYLLVREKGSYNLFNKFYTSSTKILQVLIIDKLCYTNPDLEECMNFIQQYIDITNFSELELVAYLFEDMTLFIHHYFHENHQEDHLFNTVRVNFIKLVKILIVNADKFKDNVLSNLTIFMPVYAYALKLSTNLRQIQLRITKQQQFLLQTKIKNLLLLEQNTCKDIYSFYRSTFKQLNIIHQFYQLQRIDRNNRQQFYKEKMRMEYLIERYSKSRAQLEKMMKRYIPKLINHLVNFQINFRTHKKQNKAEIGKAVQMFLKKNYH